MRAAAYRELKETESMMKELELMEGGDGPDGLGTLLDDFVVTATDVRPAPFPGRKEEARAYQPIVASLPPLPPGRSV